VDAEREADSTKLSKESVLAMLKRIDKPQFLMYSGHDSIVGPALDWLEASNMYHWSEIPFASSIHVSLSLNLNCTAKI
jgi:hypothetical protein